MIVLKFFFLNLFIFRKQECVPVQAGVGGAEGESPGSTLSVEPQAGLDLMTLR